MPKPLPRLKVSNPRHSVCGSARLADLDFGRRWTDPSFGQLYLHVAHKDGETWHRVYCRRAECPRLAWEGGELYWIVDPPKHATLTDPAPPVADPATPE